MSGFGYESSHTHRGRVSIGDFCLGECSYFERCCEDANEDDGVSSPSDDEMST